MDKFKGMDELIQDYRAKLQNLLESSRVSFRDTEKRAFPDRGGVYRLLKPDATWRESVYVGKTGNLQRRIYDNLLTGKSGKHTLRSKLKLDFTKVEIDKLLQEGWLIQFLELHDENERTFFEHFAIAILKPSFND